MDEWNLFQTRVKFVLVYNVDRPLENMDYKKYITLNCICIQAKETSSVEMILVL